jgi:hypothetical protein
VVLLGVVHLDLVPLLSGCYTEDLSLLSTKSMDSQMPQRDPMLPRRHEWSPGNGTRYELFVAPFEGPLFGCTRGGWVVVGPFSDRLRSMVVPDESGIHWTYVASKMDLNEVDASCVAMMLGKVTGLEAWPSDIATARVKVPFTPEV